MREGRDELTSMYSTDTEPVPLSSHMPSVLRRYTLTRCMPPVDESMASCMFPASRWSVARLVSPLRSWAAARRPLTDQRI